MTEERRSSSTRLNQPLHFLVPALPLAFALILSACSASGDSKFYGNAGGNGSGSEGGMLDTGFTGDGEMDPDSSCATATLQAERIPLDMFFMLDTSGSMEGPKLELLQTGLISFLQESDSIGIGVAGQMFPIGGFNETCDSNAYASSAVPWEILPAQALVNWIHSLKAEGLTPSVPALRGAVDACKTRASSEPGRKCAVVFVSDGQPEGNCAPVANSAIKPLGEIAAEAKDNGIPVFAIGFYGINSIGQSVLAAIALHGGTEVPFAIKEGSVSQDFVEALNEARGTALGCEYQMPTAEQGMIDPKLVRVIYTPGTTEEPETVPWKETLDDCGSSQGWAYDNNENPTKLIMCPATCGVMRSDNQGKVEILLGCSSWQR